MTAIGGVDSILLHAGRETLSSLHSSSDDEHLPVMADDDTEQPEGFFLSLRVPTFFRPPRAKKTADVATALKAVGERGIIRVLRRKFEPVTFSQIVQLS